MVPHHRFLLWLNCRIQLSQKNRERLWWRILSVHSNILDRTKPATQELQWGKGWMIPQIKINPASADIPLPSLYNNNNYCRPGKREAVMKGWKGKGKKNLQANKKTPQGIWLHLFLKLFFKAQNKSKKNRAGCMRGGAKKLSELERCECHLHNAVSDLTWTRSQCEWGRMLKVQQRSHLGEVRGSGVIYFFPHNLQIYTHTGSPARLEFPSLPFPPLRELITVCKVRQNCSIFQYKSETLNHTPYHCLLTERWGARSKSVLALMLVPW